MDIFINIISFLNIRVVAEYLRPLPEDQVQRMYRDATSRERVFRNVLLSLADNKDESAFFKAASIDEIFDRYVRIEGHVTRVSNYRLGPSNEECVPLSAEELLIHIQTSGPSWEKLYQILKDDQVKFLRNATVMMH